MSPHKIIFVRFTVSMILLLLFFSTAVFAQKTKRAADALVSEGITLYKKGTPQSFEQALYKFDEARQIRAQIGDRAGEAAALTFLGSTYKELGNVEGVVNNYSAALKIFREIGDKTGEGSVLNNYAAAQRDFGFNKESVETYESAIPILRQHGSKTDLARAISGQGQALLALGEYPKAVANLEQALDVWNSLKQQHDDKIRTIYALAVSYYRIGSKQQTEKYAQQAVSFSRQQRNPDLEVEVLEALASVYDETGDKKTAIEYRKDALQAYQKAGAGKIPRSKWDTVVNNLADVYYRAGDLNAADKILTGNIRNGVSGEDARTQSYIFGTLGEVYTGKGEFDKAAQYLNKGIELAEQAGDQNSVAYNLASLGIVNVNVGQIPQAVDNFNKALSFFKPGTNPAVESKALAGLIFAYTAAGNKNAGEKAIQRAEKSNLDKGNGVPTVQVLNAMGQFYSATGDAQKALQIFERAFQMATDRGDYLEAAYLLSNLGYNYASTGNHMKALESYETADKFWTNVGNNSSKINALIGMGWANLNLSRTNLAVTNAQQVLRLSDNIANPVYQAYYKNEALHILGKSAAKTNDFESAINYYNQAFSLAQQSNNAAMQKHYLNDIADIYEAKGDKKEAKKFRKQADKIKDRK